MVLTLGFAGAEEGVVLCFGGDGHVTIEASGPEGCSDDLKAAPRAASAVAIPISSSHCGPCFDVALTSTSATEAVKTTKQTPPAPAAILAAELRPPVLYLRASISYRHTTRFISEKPYTVVIRC